jgi:hypothetical protein
MAAPPADPAAEGSAGVSQPEANNRWMKVVTRSAWCALLVYTVLLFFRARLRQDIGPTGSEVTLSDLLALRQWLYEGVLANIQMGFCLFLFGFLVAVGFGRAPELQKTIRTVGRWFLMALLGAVTFAFLVLIETGRLPSLLSSLGPMTGFLLGVWVGRNVLRGPRAVLWLAPKMMVLLLIGAVAFVAIGFLAVARNPLPIQPPEVTSAEKRRLVEILKNPRPLDDGTRQLDLSERDLNLILAMGLPQVLPRARGTITLEEGTVTADLSAPLTDSEDSTRYVNVQAAWDVAIADGELHVDFVRCRIGRVPVPGFILDGVLRQGIVLVLNDRDLNEVLTAIGSFHVHDDSVEAVLVSRGLVDNILPSLMARLGQSPNVVAKARVYYEHLAKPMNGVAVDDRFTTILQSAFALARSRSQTEDPVLENRAAILALAIMLGHRRVEHLVGRVTDDELRRQSQRNVGFVRLRGRTDWSRHFLVSSALALLSNESVSDEAGLFKEELDAGEHGSGFSFSDLLADRAGTLFALAATRDEQSARRMQALLADGFDLGAIFPEAADLPEGIPDARFGAEYGGVGGEQYGVMIGEIERRLGECGGLR